MEIIPYGPTIEDIEKKVGEVYLLVDIGVVRIIIASVVANRLNLSDAPVWLLLLAGSSSGKCLGKNTPIIMYDGSVKMSQDIKKGDLLMGDDSKPRTVLSTTTGVDTMYKIIQETGDNYIVNSPHILSLKYTSQEKKYKGINKGDVIDIDLPTYLNKNATFKNKFKGYKVGVNFKKQKITIDPYFLGIWLGDGKSTSTGIYKPDSEIKRFVQSYSKKINLSYSSPFQGINKCPIHVISNGKRKNPLGDLLKSYNLYDYKHIPQEYKINSREVRLQVLAGILDTDGYYDKKRNSFEFSNKSKILAEDVVFLARSLGFYASIKQTKKSIKKIGFSGKYWRVYISGEIYTIPTKIKRKQATRHVYQRNVLTTGIKVKKLKKDTYYGFTLDGNGRFLLGDFTVTHNTIMLKLLDKCGSYIIPIDTLTTNTFASALQRDDEVSLLHKANNGILVFKDFTALTSMNEKNLEEVMGQMRSIYDGSFNKKTGNANDIDWAGKIGIIAAGTIAVQRKMRQFSENGERFLNYILQVADPIEITRRAMFNQKNLKEKETELAIMVAEFINTKLSLINDKVRQIPADIEDEMIKVANLCTKARSPVIMNKKNPAIVDFVPDREMPPRMAMMLKNMAVSLMVISNETELSEKNAKILYKVGLDSIPVERRIALRMLAAYREVSTRNLAIKLNYTTETVRAWCNQLNALKMIDRISSSIGGQGDAWVLKEEYKELICEYENIIPKDEILQLTVEEEKNAYITEQDVSTEGINYDPNQGIIMDIEDVPDPLHMFVE